MGSERAVFIVSDRTGLTAEAMARALMSQFDHMEFVQEVLPFADSRARIAEAVARINLAASHGPRPIVFSTLADPDLRAALAQAQGRVIDLFDFLLAPLEAELGSSPSGAMGKAHGMHRNYGRRIEAMNFALDHDDGLGTRLGEADVVLMGVSRCGKTPTCLYLALNYGLHAANYPLTAEDLAAEALPGPLRGLQGSLFGLSIQPERLAQIRAQRKPGSDYAALDTCLREVRRAEALFRTHRIPFVDSTAMSIEEIAARIVHERSLRARP